MSKHLTFFCLHPGTINMEIKQNGGLQNDFPFQVGDF